MRETGFLQDLAEDDKRRFPEKTLAGRTRREGQCVSKMPEHTKEQKAAEETWASWKKKVLGGPAGAFVEEVAEKDVTVIPTTIFGVKQQYEMDSTDLRFKHRKISVLLWGLSVKNRRTGHDKTMRGPPRYECHHDQRGTNPLWVTRCHNRKFSGRDDGKGTTPHDLEEEHHKTNRSGAGRPERNDRAGSVWNDGGGR